MPEIEQPHDETTEKPESTETNAPLYECDSAPIDRLEDLVLLVLDHADGDSLDHDTLIERTVMLVEDHIHAFPFEFEQEDSRDACRDTIDFFASLGYLDGYPTPPNDKSSSLTERGERGATALRAGLTDDQRAALQEVEKA